MSLIKKIDVEKHFAERRAMRLGRMQPVSQLGATWIKSTVKRNRASASAGPPALGLTSSTAPSAPIPVSSDSGRNRLLRPLGSRHQ
jgi:hypothetical protein